MIGVEKFGGSVYFSSPKWTQSRRRSGGLFPDAICARSFSCCADVPPLTFSEERVGVEYPRTSLRSPRYHVLRHVHAPLFVVKAESDQSVVMSMNEPKFCRHCGAVVVADSDRPHLEIGPRFRTLEPRWATLEGAAVYSGLSRRLLQLAGKEGHIRTAHVKRGADNKRGRRLVDLRSLDAWIEKYICS